MQGKYGIKHICAQWPYRKLVKNKILKITLNNYQGHRNKIQYYNIVKISSVLV